MCPRTLIKIQSYFGDRKVHYQSKKVIVKRIFSGKYNRAKPLLINHPEPHRHRLALLPLSLNLLSRLLNMKKKELKQYLNQIPLLSQYYFINHVFIVYDVNGKNFAKIKFVEVSITPTWKLLICLNLNQEPIIVVVHHLNHDSSDKVILEPNCMLLFLHVIRKSQDEKITELKLQAYGLSKETIKTVMKFIHSHGRISLEKMHLRIAQIQRKRILYRVKQQYRDQLQSIDSNYSYISSSNP